MADVQSSTPARKGALAGFDMAAHVRRIKSQDKVATVILTAIVGLVLVMLAAIVGYVLISGAGKLFDISFLTGKPEQFKAVPISLGAAIFLAEYAPDNTATHIAKTLIETLSSLPSIVVGLFGFLFFVLSMGWGFSIIAGAVALTMFNVPILVRVVQQALEDVPRTQRDAALAMGLTRWETTVHVLLPVAMPAIVTGVVLSAGRVFGEAAALIFTAGQSAPMLDFANFDLSSPTCPWNVFRPAETLAVHIWKINSEGVVPDLEAVSNGTAAVLLVCILLFNVLARFIGKFLERRLTSE